MKRIILIISILFTALPVLSQSFKVNYRLTARPANSTYGDGCNNNINVKIFYRINGGSEISKQIFNQDLNGGGGTYNFPQTIYGGDVVFTKVEVRTSRNWKRLIGGCGGNGSFNNSLRTTSINSRCTKLLSGSNLARWWVTSLNIDIKPVVNLTPKNVIACQSGAAVVNSGFHSSKAYSGIYRWEFLDPVNTVSTITTAYQNLINASDQAYQIWQDCENFSGGGGPGDPIFRASGNVKKTKYDNSVAGRPPIGPIPGGNPSANCRRWYDRYVTAYQKVRDYTGQKYYPRKIWRAIPSENGKAIANITLTDLYSRESDRLKALTNKVISIRINPNCSGEGDINTPVSISQIQFFSDPPPITKTEFSSPTCSYDPIDNFKIFFSRQLLSTERLNINLKKKLSQAPFTYETIANNINISSFQEITSGSLYSYTWNPSNGNELPEAGEYRIELSGASGNPFCNNGTLQYDFSIAIPPKVNFLSAVKEQDVTCFNGSDGKIKITASGGSNSFQYSIDNKATWSAAFTNSTIITGRTAGTHKIWLRDSKSCIDQDFPSRNVTLAPKAKITHVVTANTNEIINPGKPGGTDGSIKINSVSGGTPSGNKYDYEVLLNGNSSTILSGTANGTSSTIIENLPKGTHKIRYSDSKGCVSEAYTLPTLSDPQAVEFDQAIVNAKCKGANGQIKVSNVRGGYKNYKIKVEGSGITPLEETNVPPSTEKIFNVKAGTYKITVTDTRSGIKVKNSIIVGEPNEIIITNVNASNIDCNGGKSTVTITTSGGQTGVVYEYAIHKPSGMVWQSSNTFSLDASPTVGYRFVARDKNQTFCKSQPSTKTTISEPTSIVLGTPQIIDNTIFNGITGEIQIPISGGTPGYTVTWTRNGSSIGKTGATITGLTAGTYIATVKDSKQCTLVSSNIIVDEPDELKVFVTIDSEIDCNGGNGVVRANPSGGSESYTYKWYRNNTLISGANSITYQGISGNYEVEVNDGYISKRSAIKNLGQPNTITLSLTKEDISCNTVDDGKITINASGGTPPYYYSIDDKTTYTAVSSLDSNTITDLTDGVFNVWIKDANDCEISSSKSVTIVRPPLLEITSFNIDNNQVINESKGAIQIVVDGGTKPYTFSWTRKNDATYSSSNQNISDLPASIYIVEVADEEGCKITKEFDVKEPLPLGVTIQKTKDVLCKDDVTGELFAEVTGGYPLASVPSDFDYRWYEVIGSTTNLLNASNLKLDRISNLKAAKYRVVVNDVKGTSTSADFEITEPDAIRIAINKQQNVSCFEGNDGVIEITVTGGTAPFTYKWTNDLDATFNASTKDISTLKEGDYTLEITDKNNCKFTSNIIKIEQPTSKISIDSFNVVNLTGFETNNGSISVDVSGGTPGYTYEWRVKGTTTIIGTLNSIDNLSEGNYELTIKDSKLCSLVQEYPVTQPDLLVVNSINQIGDILCNGDKGINLEATGITGGVTPYSYSWNFKGVATVLSATTILEDVGAGTYVITVTDKNDNVVTKEYTISEPVVLEISNVDTQDVSCHAGNNAFIDLTVSGGVLPYTYSWKHGETTSRIEDLKEGVYEVTIRDKNLCEVTQSFTISQPSSRLSLTNENVVNLTGFETNNGSISIEVLGGTQNYTYEWRVKGETTIIGNSNSINNLSANFYELTVIDSNSCSLVEEFLVSQPSLLEVNVVETLSILCNGDKGILTANVSGGVTPYSYSWNLKGDATVLSTTDKLENIAAGIYVITIIDKNSNITTKEYTILEPAVLEISNVDTQDVSCHAGNDAFIDLTVSGGVLPYTYSWKHGATTSKLENLTKGTYEVTIRDKNLCEVTRTFTITEPVSALAIDNSNVTNLTGFETNNGSISVDVVGGTPVYTYEWRVKGTTAIIGSSNSIDNLSAGDYELTIKDSKLCEVVRDFTVTQPSLLEVDVVETLSILCNGDKGILTANVSGGVTPYSYSWNLKGDATVLSITDKLENIAAGIYVITIIDKNSNITTKEYTISEPAVLEISNVDTQNVSCHAGNDAFIDLTVSGGVLPYTYSWKHGATTSKLENLTKGTYEVTIRDKNLCEVTRTFTITEPVSALAIDNSSVTNLTGFETNNGSISVDVVGGTPVYTYEWKVKGTTAVIGSSNSIDNLSAGDYELTIKDSKLCEVVRDFTITQPGLLEVDVVETLSILCNGDKGILTANVSGGVTPYSYSWNLKGDATVLSTTNKLEDIIAGIYVVVVKDKNGNETTKEYTISQPDLLEITNVQTVDVTCYNGNNGAIELTVIGGVAPYTYSWNHTTDNTNKLENISAGNYFVTISDNNGCEITRNIEIIQPDEYDIISVKLERPSSDLVNDGIIEVEITGGAAPYTYLWTDELGNTVSNQTTSLSIDRIENLGEGTYTINITDTNNCVINETYNLANPGEILVSITQLQEIKCYNSSNAILDVITVGGVGGNSYQWYNATNDQLIGSDKQLKNIPAGQYYVIVSNAEGIQEKSSVFVVTQPEEIKVAISSNDPTCFGFNNGNFDFTVQGGTGNYEFRYRKTTGYSDWNAVTGNSATVNNLDKGNYTLQVRDANNCLALDASSNSEFSITINEPSVLELSKEETVNLTGFATNNGSVLVEVTGGSPGYSYQWLDGSGVEIATGVTSLSNLAAGTYTFNVTDTKGCSLTKEFVLTQPELLEVSLTRTAIISCNRANDGSLQATVSGGVLGYTYQWFIEGSTTVIGTTSSISDLGPGNYYVVIEDTNSNTVTSATYSLTEPTVLDLSLSSDYVLCGTGNDWTVTTTVTGGTAPYVYLWNTGSNTANLSDVTSGTYEVTVLDANGCRIEKSITLTAPPILELSKEETVNLTGFATNNGSVLVEVTGGSPGYSYQWIDGSGVEIATGVTSLNNLAAGTYTFNVTDTKGCSLTKEFVLTQPELLEVSLTRTAIISCNGANDGSLQATVIGGVLGYTYQWFTEGSTTVIGTTSSISDLGPGNYYVVIEDTNSNTVTSATYSLTEPTVLDLSLSSDYVLCGTGNDWTVTTTVTGGTAPYVYLWNTGVNTANLSDVTSGTYEVTVLDANGCRIEKSITLTAPPILELSKEETVNLTGFETNNGSILVEVIGGTPGYSYQWIDGSGVEIATGVTSLSNLAAGTYTFNVTDTKGCSLTKEFVLTQPELLEVSLTRTAIISCNGANDGSLQATVTGGVSGYTYQWFTEGSTTVIGTTSTISDLGPGNYYVVVEDTNSNIVTSVTYALTEPTVLALSLSSYYVLCGTGNDWTVTTTVTGGTAPYVYLWNTGANTANLSDVTSGTYEVTVLDANGCQTEQSITLTAPDALIIENEVLTNPTCFEGNDGSISVNVIGGTPPYQYEWTNGDTSELSQELTAGNYEVIITDNKGCQISKAFVITNPDQIALDLDEDVTLCQGQSYIIDGRIENGVSYTWTSSNGFTSTDAVVEVTDEGIYKVLATDNKGCQVEDEIEIKRSTDDISANFLVSSQVFTDEVFVAVNVSDPVPDEIDWILPPEATIKEVNNSYAELSFAEEGEYEITLYTKKGECEAFLTKKVLVLEREFDDPDTGNGSENNNTPMIKDLVVYPNPSTGVFALEVELKEVSPISVKIFSLLSNDLIDYKTMSNESDYKVDYNLNLMTGLYFVVLESGGERIVKKIIIQ